MPVRYLSGPDLVKRGSLCCFSLELVVQGKSCRMCITTTTSAIEVASPSMYDADTHKGSLTVDTTGATQVMMQIVCICKIVDE